MSDEKNKLFTTGQFAALHGINKKTLMWYDKVGLFKPAVVRDNGYRYYKYYQSSTLDTILTLRELDVSVSEIKAFMENRCGAALEKLLEEKTEEIDRSIARLKSIRQTLVNHKNKLNELANLDISRICLVEKERKYLALVSTPAGASLEDEMALVVEEAKKYHIARPRDAVYGSLISADSLNRGDFDDYSIFIEYPGIKRRKGIHVHPKGLYLQAHCKGDWDKLPGKYREILEYAKRQGLKLYDYAYETGINETVINSMDEYITRIEIPVIQEKSV